MTRYAIGLGSNLGDRLSHLRSAHEALEPRATSGLYETAPVGGPEQGPYLNAVVVVETGATPMALLDRLQEIETAHHRERNTRWGPRTLDLDILSSDASPVSSSRLTIPHPQAHLREFVLRPLCDVWPDALVGPEGVTAEGALARLDDQGVELVARTWVGPDSRVG